MALCFLPNKPASWLEWNRWSARVPTAHAPGPTHTADLVIHDVTGFPKFVDVRVTASPPLHPLLPHLQAQKQLKRREYGHDAPAAAHGRSAWPMAWCLPSLTLR
eukprot:4633915-Amphidinium_carterae.1